MYVPFIFDFERIIALNGIYKFLLSNILFLAPLEFLIYLIYFKKMKNEKKIILFLLTLFRKHYFWIFISRKA